MLQGHGLRATALTIALTGTLATTRFWTQKERKHRGFSRDPGGATGVLDPKYTYDIIGLGFRV